MKTCPNEYELISFVSIHSSKVEKHITHCNSCLNTVLYLKKHRKEIKQYGKKEISISKVICKNVTQGMLVASIFFVILFVTHMYKIEKTTNSITYNFLIEEETVYEEIFTSINKKNLNKNELISLYDIDDLDIYN